jgi:hypothetical protein
MVVREVMLVAVLGVVDLFIRECRSRLNGEEVSPQLVWFLKRGFEHMREGIPRFELSAMASA